MLMKTLWQRPVVGQCASASSRTQRLPPSESLYCIIFGASSFMRARRRSREAEARSSRETSIACTCVWSLKTVSEFAGLANFEIRGGAEGRLLNTSTKSIPAVEVASISATVCTVWASVPAVTRAACTREGIGAAPPAAAGGSDLAPRGAPPWACLRLQQRRQCPWLPQPLKR